MCFRKLLIAVLTAASISAAAQRSITITVLHSNDLHAHVEPTVIAGKGYGGYARQATLIRKYRAEDKNVLLLNAGDCFQGTMYFNTYEGLVEAAFMNEVHYDAMCLGNHEFDRGPAVLAQFLKQIHFPVVCANLDFRAEPALAGLVQPSTVVMVGGEKIGIVGADTPDMPNISSPGPNVKLYDLATSVQNAVDGLTKLGITKIVLVTHIGYLEDQKLGAMLRDVDLIVGGHSHTPLGTPNLPGWPKSAGPYPTVVNDAAGSKLYIVQSWEWGKAFGHFKVSFDKTGKVVSLFDAAPIPVDDSIPDDPVVGSMMAAFHKPIEAQMNKVVGTASAELSRGSIANAIADSMLEATAAKGAVVAFVNAGGVRGTINPGPITYGQALSVEPFGNTLTLVHLSGAELVRVLEEGVPSRDHTGGMLYPSAGTTYTVDFSKAAGSHVSDVVIAGKPIDPVATYLVCFNNFTAGGGDSHFVLRDAPGIREDTKVMDLDALIAFFGQHNPFSPNLEIRLVERG